MRPRELILILGDQLGPDHPALAEADPAQDALLFIEAPGEATHVWSHQARIAVFIAAMRHRVAELRAEGWTVQHLRLDDDTLAHLPTLPERLAHALDTLRPGRLRVVEPGEWRLLRAIEDTAVRRGTPLSWMEDTHFLCSRRGFAQWAARKKELRMEWFYRWMRQEHRVLMDPEGQPVGGQWNYDEDNRQPYPKTGPGPIPAPARFEPDALTQEVLNLVRHRFAGHPGQLDGFIWPVTRSQALVALDTFIRTRLAGFGPHQDAMWDDTPFGWHSLLSVALNLHLLHPREVIEAAEAAWREGRAPLASVEGFIRQVLGWREFIRGVYWLDMPDLADANHLQATQPLPEFFWTGDTDMACLRDVLQQTLRHGYAHHIQRLMVLGLYGLLAGVKPQAMADWFLAIYVDAVEWVELPNVAGMALYANGGRFTSKPYAASGAYIQRMSNHCKGCRYDPKQRTGDNACPYTTLYWAFLDRHEAELAASPRTALMVKNLQRLSADERQAIQAHATQVTQGSLPRPCHPDPIT
ncbi:cryptochrome/photolyase family protein [Aquabacterium sp. A3]|uniref:cryptochrome/photolyase family protein n=1 Tax=Aquabacterium sp. A3 TaxID=3132829 RepID=UPI00404AA1A3